jgi:hypothetical protein
MCFAECCYAECRYAECHYAECRYAERRTAQILNLDGLYCQRKTNEHIVGKAGLITMQKVLLYRLLV